MSGTVKATVYLQVQPEFHGYFAESHPNYVQGAKVIGATQNRSKKPKGGTVEVKLEIEVPKAAFLPLRPEVSIIIPESLTQAHPVVVEAQDANGADS